MSSKTSRSGYPTSTPPSTTTSGDLLGLMFTACHPVLSTEARVALTLRMLGGLKTDEIARAFLVSEPTIAQRIVRAKRTFAEAGVPFEVPRGDQLAARLPSVLEVIYLIFNEGYTATAGDDWVRPLLCDEALRLGRILAGLAPGAPEVHGLVALMEIQASRLSARLGPDGEPVLLPIRIAGDGTASSSGAALRRWRTPSDWAAPRARTYCRRRSRPAMPCAHREGDGLVTNRRAYADLAEVAPSPVVELNRAIAVSMAEGPAAGLKVLDEVATHPALKDYHLLPGARGALLAKLGHKAEARAEFERAAALTRNERERRLLLGRAAACTSGGGWWCFGSVGAFALPPTLRLRCKQG